MPLIQLLLYISGDPDAGRPAGDIRSDVASVHRRATLRRVS